MSERKMSNQPVPVPRDSDRPALLSIVCPAYNEAEVLAAFHRRVRKAMNELGQAFEVVLVNDGSSDSTLDLMHKIRERHANTTIVDLSRNFGKEIALTAGLDAAGGDAVVVIDADLQDPPELIGELIAGWREGYDVVYAKRRVRHGEGLVKKATAGAFYKLMSRLGAVRLPENTGDFRLMSRKAVDAVCQLRERHRFMKGVFAWVGFPAKAVMYDRDPRAAGATKWNYWKLWNLSLEGITSFTTAPLKISSYLGFTIAFGAIVAGIFYMGKAILYGDPVAGFPTLITVMLFLGGVQLAFLGILGEYVGRIFNETKARPLYFANAVLPSEMVAAGTAPAEKPVRTTTTYHDPDDGERMAG
ncbi:glycosyltransferase family 2 protein [Parvularcula flava]|uniref:Glycosyl hydrolase n=1 Tax=Aquisalinus luteolus TaxID=1566827 RepID=A0A8J3ERR1_9PROT|nr:glycosyltransferase family 2 protein [Aquisalinus luteolus]NHK28417.1 glycosyltransferase family 2 protein [Aquisalinus luteolus]GGH98411.1 glycosyl hydrolase [Aquisalinus luteolus]